MANPNTWNVQTNGHTGDIDVAFVVIPITPAPPGLVTPTPPTPLPTPPGTQYIFFRALATAAIHFITIENDGPSAMSVWVDAPIQNPPSNVPPNFVLQKGQSITAVAGASVVVRAVALPRAKGKYVVSWCCPPSITIGQEARTTTT